MVERIQDLNLPNAVIGRLIKDALPDGINASKEFRTAVGRAASVFVIYLSSAATEEAKKANMKTIGANHVFAALEAVEFESFVEPLKEALEVYRKTAKEKKDKVPAKKKDAADGGSKSPAKKLNGSHEISDGNDGGEDEEANT